MPVLAAAFRLAFACAWMCSIASATATPRISEFMASNLSVYPDNSDFEDYSDWIELYNPESVEISLANHYLTDDLSDPFKWLITPGAVLPPHGYLMFRADGWDAGPGETRLRGYYPWGSTFQTRRYHTGFKLSAEGEAIGLFRTESPPQDDTIIAAGATWRFLDQGTNPGANWTTLAFDDGAWPQGPAELGYGDGDESTVIHFGPDSTEKYPTTHFRHTFQLQDPLRVGNIRFHALVDDGAVFYLNGTEFARVRMPAGSITYTTHANSDAPTVNAFEAVELPRALLRAGENVMAVEVHQVNPASSDLSFDARLVVSLVTSPPILVDSITFGPQFTDVSYGRNADSPEEWSFFASPTPEGPNVTEPLIEFQAAPPIRASLQSGFFEEEQYVRLEVEPGVQIRYSLDGSVPDPGSALYGQPLLLTTNAILRARSFMPGLMPGPVLTRSYFFHEPRDRSLPVISLAAAPATLFDDLIGIYHNATPYPYKGREIMAHVEFFDAARHLAFAVQAGARIGGENIWRFAQKPLNLHLRGKYGDDAIHYQLFQDEPVATFGRLNLRNGGDNWAKDMLRDALLASVLRGQSRTDLSSYRPCVVFLNGRYWGIHDLRKQFDPVFFAQEHQLSEDTYDLVQYAHNERGITVLMADAGTTANYEAFHDFYTTHDLSQPAHFAMMQESMDVDSFIDYVVTTDFGVNTSWAHNREFWRARAPGAQWRWNIPDFDRAMDAPNLGSSLIDDFRASYPLFRALDDNTNFVNRLIQRYAAHVGSTWHSNRLSTILDTLDAEVLDEIPRHIARWAAEGGMPSLAAREAELDEIRQFIIERPAFALARLQSELGLHLPMADLSIEVSPPAAGAVSIAGVFMTPEFNRKIRLFADIPVTLTAESAPGHAFQAWSNGSTDPTIELVLNGDFEITAIFQEGAETILPPILNGENTLTAVHSPYTAQGDVLVPPGATLTIAPGVTLRMPPGASLQIQGSLQMLGSPSAPVEILPRTASPWGNLSFQDATAPSFLAHFKIRGASPNRADPLNFMAAISASNSIVTLDHADIVANQPIFARYGSTTLRNSQIHILFTGDGINIKSGAGSVENSTFTGAVAPDTDAIDFDDVSDGSIVGNRIYAFRGLNSDALDIGEGCRNLLVISNRIFNITDKGVSIGQASVARLERNLIVDCGMGVGVKDLGSTAFIDQNTFARNQVGVASFEKNAGNGGGVAHVANCIFHRSLDAPVSVDPYSTLTVRYSLSDTLALLGAGNLLADPQFTDAGAYDFSLMTGSPAIDAGDPDHALDTDGSRADIGAYYTYQPADYPFLVPNIVVVNELLAHSPDAAPDWIELYNNSTQDLMIGGWHLSDDPAVPRKYRIADGTILPGKGYLVFYENIHFGAESSDPGALRPFALSENGESVTIFGARDGLSPDYQESEVFGPSAAGVSFGRYYKASSRTINFVAMDHPTPGGPNALPRVGPIVFSEIMYHPPVNDAEYLELSNVSATPVTLLDDLTREPWRMTKGITHTFPSSPPLTMLPGEKILLVRNLATFSQSYGLVPGARAFQWDSGSLDNGGETLELSEPGELDLLGIRQFIRMDRVDFSDAAPWPTGPDGGGSALIRVNERAYGNDFANWMDAPATPGSTSYDQWSALYGFTDSERDPDADPDGDGWPNAREYALGTDPGIPSLTKARWLLNAQEDGIRISFILPFARTDLGYFIQKASNDRLAQWSNLDVQWIPGDDLVLQGLDPRHDTTAFYRLLVVLFEQ